MAGCVHMVTLFVQVHTQSCARLCMWRPDVDILDDSLFTAAWSLSQPGVW